MPLNQLGTLYGSENYGCDAAYYYLYCLSCAEPFLSARENVRLLFVKNRKRYDELLNHKLKHSEHEESVECSLIEQRTKEIKKFLVLFLRIIDSILVSSSTILTQANNDAVLISNHQLQEMCQVCLQEFNSCLFYTNKGNYFDQNDKLSYLSDELIFKLTMTILMTIEHLKNKRSNVAAIPTNKTSIYFTTVAFALVFFSHIVNHTIIRLQEALLNLNRKHKSLVLLNNDGEKKATEQRRKSFDSSTSSAETSSSLSADEDQSEQKSGKKKVHLIYGLRRRKHNTDSDTNDSDEDASESQEENESEETCRKTAKPQAQRRQRAKNIAKFLDRENLSETELNIVSSDEESGHKNSRKKCPPNRINHSDSDISSDSSIDSKSNSKKTNLKQNPSKDTNAKAACEEELKLNNENEEDVLFLESGLNNDLENQTFNMSNPASMINFKEFSSQLYSRLSVIQEPSKTESTSANISHETSNEFIDNEIYKFILNGNKSVDIPPGFEIFSKEVQEIEELGKKLATFEIETDTEMSIFNSTENSPNSSKSDLEHNQAENKLPVQPLPADDELKSNKLLNFF